MISSLFGLGFGYLCGSIPFGLLLTRFAGTEDIRTIGSKNIGATNVLRTGRKDLAAATLLLDALKGTVAVWIAMRWGDAPAMLAGFGAFLGHCYPVWLKFQGGKGVATWFGVLLAFNPWIFLAAGAIWLVMALLKRYSSLSSLTSSAAIALFEVGSGFVTGRWSMGILVIVAMTALLWFKHRPNIERLLAGTEGKIGQKG
ncbi:MAG: glycerol-3-phosphate 1-O-acyltransferase PlsY [Methylobacterium sp.]|nr:glycerol-3-phosphate 1-O-acyltransferase PlsY [Methylobacterium sp.]MCZ8271191.1 glycerol-3-phosphate 1-O-acyltransferase PlsY [Beijerinckiaceae bacterium]MCA3654731.1 glycerol-3-phosphate 1-O-acyltransferase PlsY [Methylobacterium sp.]MCA3658290.1 glycerol-3-phosphate 1-O-acyltransferase PlsY [Methylobacterium sp.]MCA3664909.1 glycerol-3-phosphate 1-O-acyltransferase PlsY [Methylobacterium sp.]